MPSLGTGELPYASLQAPVLRDGCGVAAHNLGSQPEALVLQALYLTAHLLGPHAALTGGGSSPRTRPPPRRRRGTRALPSGTSRGPRSGPLRRSSRRTPPRRVGTGGGRWRPTPPGSHSFTPLPLLGRRGGTPRTPQAPLRASRARARAL